MAIHIKNLLGKYLKPIKQEKTKQQQITISVGKILGKQLKKYIKIKQIQENKIIFVSLAAAASYNLTLKKDIVIQEVQKILPHITDIKIDIR